MQQLYLIATFVDENKNISVAWVAAQSVLNYARKAIEALSHVGCLVVEMKFVLR